MCQIRVRHRAMLRGTATALTMVILQAVIAQAVIAQTVIAQAVMIHTTADIRIPAAQTPTGVIMMTAMTGILVSVTADPAGTAPAMTGIATGYSDSDWAGSGT